MSWAQQLQGGSGVGQSVPKQEPQLKQEAQVKQEAQLQQGQLQQGQLQQGQNPTSGHSAVSVAQLSGMQQQQIPQQGGMQLPVSGTPAQQAAMQALLQPAGQPPRQQVSGTERC